MNLSSRLNLIFIFLIPFCQQSLSQCCSVGNSFSCDENLIAMHRVLETKSNLNSGNFSVIKSIHPIEKSKKHYAELKKYTGSKSTKHAWMDEINYPPELYKNRTLLFALTKPQYLTSSQVEFLVNAVQFPANSSEQTRAELAYLLDLQKSRSAKQEKRVLELAKIGYWPDVNHTVSHPNYNENLEHLFFELKEVIGDKCTAENYPKTSKLLQGVMHDMRLMEYALKYHLLRARPYQLEAKLKPLKKISSPSFASGHTLWAYIQAYTLGELLPNKRNAFIELAYEIGMSREVMGVHYPSDEEAARQLAHRMLMLMWHTEKFQRDFNAAKKEW